MKKICVIGSINIDLVATVERFPKPGETLFGNEFSTHKGGKGANQAVATGRLGGEVYMAGKVGDDLYGSKCLLELKNENINIDNVEIESGNSTGIALIEVDKVGENRIVIIPGANEKVDTAYINEKLSIIEKCDIILFQLEIPLEVVIDSIKLLKGKGKTIILDPAPAKNLPDEIYKYIDYITPNETEIGILTNKNILNEKDIENAGKILLEKGVKSVILKAGSKGAYIIGKNIFKLVPAFIVKAFDTTGAGDSFNGGFAYSLSKDYRLTECVKFANAVAAISTTKKGAQSAMPDIQETEKLLMDNYISMEKG